MSPGPRLDLHVHSDRSPDGRAAVDRLVAAAVERGLDGFALTDHNTVTGHSRLADLAREHPRLVLVPGVEVSTEEGHLLAFGIDQAPPPRRPVDETIDWIVSRGGTPVLAHPFRRPHGVGGVVAARARVPALETLNGHNGPRANARSARLAASRALGATGGSDAHDAREVGRAWTVFPAGTDTVGRVIDALGRGSVVAEGRSARGLERSLSALRSMGLRLRRGLRPI
jgi:predicted metal-dependent phosphoesterase TrpH